MEKKKLIDGLIANEVTQFTDDDRDWLGALEADQLQLMVPVVNDDDDFTPCCPDAVAALIANKDSKWTAADADFLNLLTATQLEKMQPVIVTKEVPKANDDADEPKTVQEYIDAAPEGMRDVLQSGVDSHNTAKDELVANIKANKRNTFTDEELKGKSLKELQAIASLAKVPVRDGQQHQVHDNDVKEEAMETPEIDWSKK